MEFGKEAINSILPFEYFFKEIADFNCFYCNTAPSNEYNDFANKKTRVSEKGKREGLFVYSGMDRINNSWTHIEGNCFPSCITCNKFKLCRTIDEIFDRISILITTDYNF